MEKRGAIEMAKRLRQVCGQVFRYAIASGRAKRDPSADLPGALKSPGRPRGHKAMQLNDVPAFLNAVAAYDGDPRTCLALRLVVLTFVRTTELRAAQWSEIEGLNGDEPLWRIPAERMKMKHEHIVPLAPQAVAVLRKLRELPGSESSPFLFPSRHATATCPTTRCYLLCTAWAITAAQQCTASARPLRPPSMKWASALT